MSDAQQLSNDQRTALEMLAEHGGGWTHGSGWHVGSPNRTARLLESLTGTGLVVRTGKGRYGLTARGFSAMEDHLNSLPIGEF